MVRQRKKFKSCTSLAIFQSAVCLSELIRDQAVHATNYAVRAPSKNWTVWWTNLFNEPIPVIPCPPSSVPQMGFLHCFWVYVYLYALKAGKKAIWSRLAFYSSCCPLEAIFTNYIPPKNVAAALTRQFCSRQRAAWTHRRKTHVIRAQHKRAEWKQWEERADGIKNRFGGWRFWREHVPTARFAHPGGPKKSPTSWRPKEPTSDWERRASGLLGLQLWVNQTHLPASVRLCVHTASLDPYSCVFYHPPPTPPLAAPLPAAACAQSNDLLLLKWNVASPWWWMLCICSLQLYKQTLTPLMDCTSSTHTHTRTHNGLHWPLIPALGLVSPIDVPASSFPMILRVTTLKGRLTTKARR